MNNLAEQGPSADHPGLPLLQSELASQAISPPGGEPAIAAFCEAALERSHSDPEMRAVLNTMLDHRAPLVDGELPEDGVHQSEIIGVLRSTVVTYKDGLHPLFNYSGSITIKTWQNILTSFIDKLHDRAPEEHGGVPIHQIKYMLEQRNVATSVPSRYYTAELVAQLIRARKNEHFRMLDIGAGVGLAKYLMHKSVQPMHFTCVEGNSASITEQTNTIINQEQAIDKLVCVDIEKVIDGERGDYLPDTLRWFKGSKRPSERDNSRATMLDRELLSAELPGLHHVTGNLADDIYLKQFKKEHPEPFQLITLNTMLHQMSPATRQHMLKNAVSLLAPEGVLLVQDFARLAGKKRPADVNKLDMLHAWHTHEWPYTLFVYDNMQSIKGFQELARATDSRNRHLQLLGGKLAIDGANWTLEQRIRYLART